MNREMKHSGIAWIGDIPNQWEVVRHKNVMHKQKDIQELYHKQDIISLTMGGVVVRDLNAGGKMPTSFDGYQHVYPNDLLLCLFDIDVTPRCVGLVKNAGVTSPAYSRFITHSNAYAPYYDYLLRYIDDYKCFLHLSKNLRSSLTETDFGMIYTCLPPLAEQKAIADFLDKKCEEIDELVALQEKIIEELKSYKQSVITEAVCKGLNPNVPMKDSGVEWIGEIPKGWQSVPFRAIYNLTKGLNITKENLVENGVPVISYGQIHSKENSGTCIKESLLRYVPETYLIESPTCLVKKGDIIFADTSEDLEGCGNGVYIDKHMQLFAGYHTIIAQAQDIRGITKYLSYLFLTGAWRLQIRSMVNGVKLYSIPQKLLKRTTIILPPIAEQEEIADYLDKKCSEIDQLISIKQQKIVELKDYKKSLIYEYTTGKKRVEA